MVARKQKEKNGLGTKYTLQNHTASDPLPLTSPHSAINSSVIYTSYQENIIQKVVSKGNNFSK
jgi:hypothetical protein